MGEIAGKVVLITGAGKGSGRLLAKAFAERGARVAANDISPINVEQVVDEINGQGGRAKAYIEDVAKKVGVQNLINQVEDDFGRIDILINHAAVEPNVPLLSMDEWDWHRVLDVNLTGVFLMTQSAGRVMREKGGGITPLVALKDSMGASGVIINLVTESVGDEKQAAAFVASMSGLVGFTRQAARELSPYGIHVYAVENTRDTIIASVFALFE
jgi:NAD(P)-dependent dehydrogenase (short-subunit alcohol dehydrogenase family)